MKWIWLVLFALSGQTTTWYKVMTGAIDKYPVSMYLFSLDGTVTGYYYYDNGTGVPIPISGELKGGNLQLRAPGDKRGKEFFTGALTDSSYTGSWSIGEQTLSFQMQPIPKDSAYLGFDYLSVKGTQKRTKHDKEELSDDGPTYEVHTVWPKDSSVVGSLLRRDIFTLFNLQWKTGTTITQALTTSKNVFLAGSNREVSGNQPSFQYQANVDILYQTSGLLSLSMDEYAFTGGPHGNTREVYRCYDLNEGRRMNIEDIIDTLRYATAMSSLLEQQYRANYRIPAEVSLSESLFHDTIPLSGNFYLTRKGIGFQYNPYDIGPYVLGGISFFFPYAQLMPYLQPSFKQMMNLP